MTCVGDERMYSCMLSKYKDAPSDFALLEAFKLNSIKFKNILLYLMDQMRGSITLQILISRLLPFLNQNLVLTQNIILL